MAVKFLDNTGLGYFWSKIKAWCNATFAAITHSHVWSTITGKPTTISGYGITDAKIDNGIITLGSNSITPLTSHQTLPTLSRTISGSGNAITDITVSGHAITATKGSTFLTNHQDISGKVNKSGDTMTGQLIINRANSFVGGGLKLTGNGQNFAISILDTSVTKGTAPSTTRYWGIDFYGKDVSDYNQRIAMIDANLTSENVSSCYLRAYNCTTNTNTSSIAIGVSVDASGNGYTYAPTPTAADNSTKIATTAFVKAQGYITSSGSITGNAATVSGTAGTSALAWNSEVTLYTVGGNAIKAKLPVNPNTDTLMTQNVTTANATYPILAVATADATANLGAKTGIFGAGVKINPYYSKLIANEFIANGMNGIRFRQTDSNKYTSFIRNDGDATYWLLTNANDPDGGWNDFRPLIIDNATGACSISGNAATVTGMAGTSALSWNTETILYTVGGHAIKAKLPVNPSSYSYAGSWDSGSGNDRTITNCTVGKPIIIVFAASAGDAQSFVKVQSGAVGLTTPNNNAYFAIGVNNYSTGSLVCIATSTTVVIRTAVTGGTLYVYR